jgi:hypothetical protein
MDDMKAKTTLFILLAILLSCKKSSNSNVVLSTQLTDCPANSTCTYSYYENADFVNANAPVPGNYRLFSYQTGDGNSCGPNSKFYFKIPTGDADFDISSNQIVAGKVFAYFFDCPCCDLGMFDTAIGGEIKGKRTDATHWLVNATIVFGTSATAPVDTLIVNQYFTRQPLP